MVGAGSPNDAGHRLPWRLAQAAAGLPVAMLAFVWVGRLLFVPETAVTEAQWFISSPWRLLPTIVAVAFVLWVDRRLGPKAVSPPSVPPMVDPPGT